MFTLVFPYKNLVARQRPTCMCVCVSSGVYIHVGCLCLCAVSGRGVVGKVKMDAEVDCFITNDVRSMMVDLGGF